MIAARSGGWEDEASVMVQDVGNANRLRKRKVNGDAHLYRTGPYRTRRPDHTTRPTISTRVGATSVHVG